MLFSLPSPAAALVFASPDTEPTGAMPQDFPYWEYVTQRRYEGPTVLYLGSGYAMTARHVGMGEILLDGEIIEPVPGSKRSLLNASGSAADAMIFKLELTDELDSRPPLPLASEPPILGEEIWVVGFGKGREKVVEHEIDGVIQYGFVWTRKGEKRWGTNRVKSISEILTQKSFSTRALSFDFDPPHSSTATRYEAQAAVGDSGGAVFVKRDGEWLLAAMMISVSGRARGSEINALYGDLTYAVDLSYYRDQVLRWTRPACSNEIDDDGDERMDYPSDPGCDHPGDFNERDHGPLAGIGVEGVILVATPLVAVLGAAAWIILRRQRGMSTPSSTRPSSAS